MAATRSDQGQRRTQWVALICDNATCINEFEKRLSETRQHNYCSRSCFQTSSLPAVAGTQGGGRPRHLTFTPGTRPNAPTELLEASAKYGDPLGWIIDRTYVLYDWPAHPDSTGKRITEHRAVVYEHMGIELNGHHIRHLNNDPIDNTWTNLLVEAAT